LKRRRAVGLGRFENVCRQRFEAGKQDERHERRPLPGVDDDQRRQGGRRVAQEATRIGPSPGREVITEQAIIGGEQRAKDKADDHRRHRHRDQQQRQADALEETVAPQKQRDGEAKEEFRRDGGQGEDRRGDQRIAR
jgi:hypothetical protein